MVVGCAQNVEAQITRQDEYLSLIYGIHGLAPTYKLLYKASCNFPTTYYLANFSNTCLVSSSVNGRILTIYLCTYRQYR